MSALAWLNAGSQLLGAVGGITQAPPSTATSGIAPTVSSAEVDFSGWTVATGNAKADGATITRTKSDPISGDPVSAPSGGINLPGLLTLVGGGLLAYKSLS